MTAGPKRRLRVLRGYDGPPGGHAVVITLFRVFGRMSDAMSRVMKSHGLTLPHFEVLMCLKAGEGISQQDVSNRLLVTKGNICVIVQKLESAGLIDRRSDPNDQRFHRLYLTDGGRRVIANILPDQNALVVKLLGGLSQAEQKTLHELLGRIDQAFDDMEL